MIHYSFFISRFFLRVKTTDNCRVIYEVLEYSPLCDSSDMTMDDWILIANDIKVNHSYIYT